MPALCRSLGEFQSGNASADHSDGLGRCRRRKRANGVSGLVPGVWIVSAADTVALIDLVYARVIARYAEPYFFRATFSQLVGGLRVGDELTAQADEVGLTRLQDVSSQ